MSILNCKYSGSTNIIWAFIYTRGSDRLLSSMKALEPKMQILKCLKPYSFFHSTIQALKFFSKSPLKRRTDFKNEDPYPCNKLTQLSRISKQNWLTNTHVATTTKDDENIQVGVQYDDRVCVPSKLGEHLGLSKPFCCYGSRQK